MEQISTLIEGLVEPVTNVLPQTQTRLGIICWMYSFHSYFTQFLTIKQYYSVHPDEMSGSLANQISQQLGDAEMIQHDTSLLNFVVASEFSARGSPEKPDRRQL